MDYDQLYKTAKETGKLKYLTPERIKFKEGDIVTGLYLGRDLIKTKQKKGTDFYVYHFNTNNGIVQFPLSNSFDKGDGESMEVGAVYAIEHHGFRQLSKGRQFKELTAALVLSAEDVEKGVVTLQD